MADIFLRRTNHAERRYVADEGAKQNATIASISTGKQKRLETLWLWHCANKSMESCCIETYCAVTQSCRRGGTPRRGACFKKGQHNAFQVVSLGWQLNGHAYNAAFVSGDWRGWFFPLEAQIEKEKKRSTKRT